MTSGSGATIPIYHRRRASAVALGEPLLPAWGWAWGSAPHGARPEVTAGSYLAARWIYCTSPTLGARFVRAPPRRALHAPIRAMIRASFEGRVTRGTKRGERGAAIADSTCLFPRSMEFTHWFHQQIHRQLAGGSNGRMKVSFRWGQPSKRSEYNI